MEMPSVPQRINAFRRFLAGRNDSGPLMGFFFESYYPLRRYRAAAKLPKGIYRPGDLRVEDFREDYERLYQIHEKLAGDFLWTGSAFWGVPWMEAVSGCPVLADHETGSCRSLPRSDVSLAEDIGLPDPENPWVRKAREYLQSLSRWSRGRYPLGTTLMRGIGDLLSAVYGNPDFVFRLIDEPQKQQGVIERLTDLWISFARAQLAEIPDYHGGVGVFFYNCWIPGRGIGLQDDASALLSPGLYEDHILPAQKRILQSFDSCLFHLHPTGFIPAKQLSESAVSIIELHIDVGGPGVEDLIATYRQIQQEKPLLIWGELDERDVAFLLDNLDRRSLALSIVVSSAEKAEALWRRFKA